MRKILSRITITTVFSVFILLQTSFAQSNIGHPPLVHPGIMMTAEQLDFMRDRIDNGIEPQITAYNSIKNDSRAAKDYEPNYIHFDWTAGERDAQACWVQGLMWAITQEEVYAENVLKIMDAYSTLESVTGGHIELSIGLMGTMFMRGAEIVKHTYSKWRPETEEAFMDMYDKAFMPALLTRVEHENNWMASITESLMASAIFKDDRELFDLAVYRLKIYVPTNIPLEDGQPAELWRDIAHAQEGIGALVQTAEMAWNQGIDAYGWLDNRMAKGMEYLAEVIETEDDRFEKNYLLPVGWDVVYNHYHHRMGMDLPWTYKLVQTIRPEGLIRHTSLGTLIKGDMNKDIPLAISHWRLPLAYTGASYLDSLTRYGCTSPIEWALDETTPMPSALNISSDGLVTGNVDADSGAYKIILKSSGASCDSLSTTYYLPVTTMLPAVEANVTKPGLWYEYRTPDFETDPGLNSIESIATDSTSSFSFSVATDVTYAIRFSGYLDVPADGGYSFQVGTQNQSRLYIDDQLVVDHWMDDNRARIAWSQFDSEVGLKAGKHKIVLTVNNGNYDRGQLYGTWPSMAGMLEVQWKIPGDTSYVTIPQSATSIAMEATINDVIPNDPSDLIADSISSSEIDISWTDNANNESGYIIERKEGAGTYTTIATLGADTTSYSDTRLKSGRAYTYRVVAFNAAYTNVIVAYNAVNNSNYSNEATATTGLNSSGLFLYNASDDAYVRGGSSAEENFGTAADLVVKQGTNSSFFRKSLIKFDLVGAQFGTADIEKATLRLYAKTATTCTNTVSEIGDNWTESSVTWATAPTVGNSISSAEVSSNETYYTWDVTSYVQSQMAVDEIVSFCIEDIAASNTQIIFNSKEAGDSVPELLIKTDTSSTPITIISEDTKQLVSIYPNPLNDDVLSIDLVGYNNHSNVNVEIANLMGQIVYKENTPAKDCIKINTSGVLTSGVYWVSVAEGQAVSTNKLIVE